LDAANYAALCNLGLIYKRKRMFGESIRVFLQAVEIDPYGVATWINLGEISLSLNNLADAKTFFERALSFQSGLTDILLQLCNIEFRLNAIDDFVSHSDQLLQKLELDRNRTLNTMEDIATMLLDMDFALRHRPESAALVFSTLSLLPVDYGALSLDGNRRDREPDQNWGKSSFIAKRLDELCRLAKKPAGACKCTIN
jgi:tetratricopeptide (TPR) repeat protein